MTAATTTSRPSPRGPWSSRSPASPSLPIPAISSPNHPSIQTSTPANQSTPRLSNSLSPYAARTQRSTSPNYFEYVANPNSNPPNSNAGTYTKKNWSPSPISEQEKSIKSPPNWPLEANPRFENFRRQSEGQGFNLSRGSLPTLRLNSTNKSSDVPTTIENVADKSQRRRAPLSPRPNHNASEHTNTAAPIENMETGDVDHRHQLVTSPEGSTELGETRSQSPAKMSSSDLRILERSQISHIDERHPRNSLPHNRIDPPSTLVQRSETLPSSISIEGPTMITPHDFLDIVERFLSQDILILDLRVNPQYTKSRIYDALNLCIPTTLLKRASFNVQRLADTFSKETEKMKFIQWKQTKFVIVYDAGSTQLKDATSSVNTLKKFTGEKYDGATLILRGGFSAFSKSFPDKVDNRPAEEMTSSTVQNLSIEPPAAAPVAGGCVMPVAQTAANPFFGSIRQNMDLIGGVGQIPVERPMKLLGSASTELPSWLGRVSSESDNGKIVADSFLAIEKAEQHRMQKALSGKVVYGSPNTLSPEAVQIAGIEKGTKNRYKDMLPYDHTRVKLQNVPLGGCDYVNASHIKAQYSNKHFIASQAPVPDTFQDFWRVIWEQDARVIVMLTAEVEGGQRKCHPYWLPDDYGPFKLKALSERHQAVETFKPRRSFTSPQHLALSQRPSISRRHTGSYMSHQPSHPSSSHTPTPPLDPDAPHVIIRKITLQHANQPFEPLRELTQIQYTSWPDFGAPAHPAQVLGLVEHCNSVVRSHEYSNPTRGIDDPAQPSQRPIVVHCSAGCGRTGTFCTVDSVIDMLKRQKYVRQSKQDENAMDVDSADQDAWTLSDDEDLVVKAVSDFRLQRLSMVQTLRQFVLCYETVLEWIASEMPDIQRGEGN